MVSIPNKLGMLISALKQRGTRPRGSGASIRLPGLVFVDHDVLLHYMYKSSQDTRDCQLLSSNQRQSRYPLPMHRKPRLNIATVPCGLQF